LKGERCQFAHGQNELKIVCIVEDAPLVKRLKDDHVAQTLVKPSPKKKMSRMENAKQAMPLDQPMKVGSLEPMKINLDDAAPAFARQSIRPPYNLDIPAAKSMQPNQQEMIPPIQGFEKPYYVPSLLKQQMHFQAMRAPPGLGGDTSMPLLDCQRFGQDLNLDDRPPAPEDSNPHYEFRALCMGHVSNPNASTWDSPNISGYSRSLCEKPAMQGIANTFGDFGMTRFNSQVIGDNMNMLKYNY
jgi:hypothetical protein